MRTCTSSASARPPSSVFSYIASRRHVRTSYNIAGMFIRRTSSSCSGSETRRHVRTSYIVVLFGLRNSSSCSYFLHRRHVRTAYVGVTRARAACSYRPSFGRSRIVPCVLVRSSFASIYLLLVGVGSSKECLPRARVSPHDAMTTEVSRLPLRSRPPRRGARNEGGQGRAIAWARASQSATGAVGITRAHCRAQHRRPRAWFSCCVLLPLPLPSALRLLLLLLLLRAYSRHLDDVIVTIPS